MMNHVGLAPSIHRLTCLRIEALLRIAEPDPYLEPLVAAGIDALTVHVEGVIHLHRTLDAIAKLGKWVGVALNPAGVRTGMALMRAGAAGAV